MAFIYLILATLLNGFLFGYIYQIKILKYKCNPGVFVIPAFDWIYSVSPAFWRWFFRPKLVSNFFLLGNQPVKYRLFQFVLFLCACAAAYTHDGWISVAAVALSHYLLTYDFLTYVWLEQLDEAKNLPVAPAMYDNFKIGRLLFKPYSYKKFLFCSLLGLTMVLFSLILTLFK